MEHMESKMQDKIEGAAKEREYLELCTARYEAFRRAGIMSDEDGAKLNALDDGLINDQDFEVPRTDAEFDRIADHVIHLLAKYDAQFETKHNSSTDQGEQTQEFGIIIGGSMKPPKFSE